MGNHDETADGDFVITTVELEENPGWPKEGSVTPRPVRHFVTHSAHSFDSLPHASDERLVISSILSFSDG